jgi:hypothetical protein
MSRVLHADAHVRITVDEATRIVHYVRSDVPYPSLETLREIHEAVKHEFEQLPAGKLALLVDVRAAHPRNDAAFESETQRALGTIMGRFVARASIVKSAVGRLQVTRLSKSRGDDQMAVFTSEPEALAFLHGKLGSPG